jgi:hypothetical protein
VSYFCDKSYIMITRVIGVCLLIFSSLWLLITTFVYLNSSAVLNYNKPTQTMPEAGVFFPFMVFAILWIFGFLLVKDKVYDHHH